VNIIEFAKREINSKTDISFEYEQIKDGRKVVSILFKISKNRKAQKDDVILDDPKLYFLASRLASHGMAEETARALVLAHDPELVAWALSELERRLKAKVETPSPAGWLHDAIVKNYRPQQSLFEKQQEEGREEEKKREARKGELETKILNIQKAYNAFEKSAIMVYTDILEDDERKTLESGFRANMASGKIPAILAKKFEGGPSWYSDPLIKSAALEYLKETRPDFFVLPIEAWAEQNGTPDYEGIKQELEELRALG
jgi:Initiator Replication protein